MNTAEVLEYINLHLIRIMHELDASRSHEEKELLKHQAEAFYNEALLLNDQKLIGGVGTVERKLFVSIYDLYIYKIGRLGVRVGSRM